jgi:hypothetical protein
MKEEKPATSVAILLLMEEDSWEAASPQAFL